MGYIKDIIKKVSGKDVEVGFIPKHKHSFTKHNTKLKKNKRKNDTNISN